MWPVFPKKIYPVLSMYVANVISQIYLSNILDQVDRKV